MNNFNVEEKNLLEIAKNAASKSYSPYSSFPVGAALLTKEGDVYAGANVENAAFGSTICAERAALLHANIHGFRKFKALAIYGAATESPIFPCGACRQMLIEFGDMKVLLMGTNQKVKKTTLKKLLPMAFKK